MNRLIFLTFDDVKQTGLPYYTGSRWVGKVNFEILLSTHRRRELEVHVLETEEPVAFRYYGSHPDGYKYIPVYDRSALRSSHQLLGKEFVHGRRFKLITGCRS